MSKIWQIHFDRDANMINSLNSDQNSNSKFEIDERHYILDKNDLNNIYAITTSMNSLPNACNLDPEKLKQLCAMPQLLIAQSTI